MNENDQTTKSLNHQTTKPLIHQLGQTGEELAADYLMKHGFRILHKNWNLHHGCELDIVAQKNGVLHFVEVKTRRKVFDGVGGRPEEAVDDRKIRNIGRAIQYYMSYFHLTTTYVVDVIGIVYRSDEDYDLNFMEDISIPVSSSYHTNGGRRFRR